jgi:hypothetical protein
LNRKRERSDGTGTASGGFSSCDEILRLQPAGPFEYGSIEIP